MSRELKLISEIKKCRICAKSLPHQPRPVLSFSKTSKVVIIGQAPGLRVHESGIPWNDASGDRLRDWLGVTTDQFYDNRLFAIVPMGFCYPGKGKSGDLPPRPECAEHWMEPVQSKLQCRKITLLIGKYAQEYFLKDSSRRTLTETVRNWQHYLPTYFVLPHPSPRNNIWMKKNPWFETDVLPNLKKRLENLI